MSTHLQIVEYLNNKKYKEINNNLQEMLTYISTSKLSPDTRIYSSVVVSNLIKPNIQIQIDKSTYYISVLSGRSNSVHEESQEDIIVHLKTLNAPEIVLDFINGLCLSDNHTSAYCRIYAQNDFNNYNRIIAYFDKSEVKQNLIHRFIKIGIHNNISSDFFYYGNIYKGKTISTESVTNYLANKQINTRIIPIGGLTLQRKNRYVNNHIQIKWRDPSTDMNKIHEISKRKS